MNVPVKRERKRVPDRRHKVYLFEDAPDVWDTDLVGRRNVGRFCYDARLDAKIGDSRATKCQVPRRVATRLSQTPSYSCITKCAASRIKTRMHSWATTWQKAHEPRCHSPWSDRQHPWETRFVSCITEPEPEPPDSRQGLHTTSS